MFRAERPQRGRQRQFYQLGAEILNAQRVDADIEILALADILLSFLGVQNLSFKHNYLGTDQEKQDYAGTLRDYFLKHTDKLCQDCHYRIKKNILRVLDCKETVCREVIQSAPQLVLGRESRQEYDKIQNTIGEMGIEAVHEPRLVRGLDYYTGFVFEIVAAGDLGSQDAVAAGGRYDNLVASLGGPAMGAIGFAAGMERVLLAGDKTSFSPAGTVYAATLDSNPQAKDYFQQVLKKLYGMGRRVKRDPHQHHLSDHLKKANKIGIRLVLIIGEDEVKSRQVTVRDLEAKTQERIPLDDLPLYLIRMKGDRC
jgi:histidyl-tRNA synthetase